MSKVTIARKKTRRADGSEVRYINLSLHVSESTLTWAREEAARRTADPHRPASYTPWTWQEVLVVAALRGIDEAERSTIEA